MRETKNLLPNFWRVTLAALAALALFAAAAFPWLRGTQAQRRSSEPAVNVTGVGVHQSGAGEVVTITADAPLSRAQTWADDEGFHVVGYKWQGAFGGAPRGVKVRRVGDSLEIVIATRAGANVTVLPRGNSLDMIVAGGVARASADAEPKSRARGTESKSAGGQERRAVRDEATLAVAASHGQSARQTHDASAGIEQARGRRRDAQQSQPAQNASALVASAQDASAQRTRAKNSPAQGTTQQPAQNQIQQNAAAQGANAPSSQPGAPQQNAQAQQSQNQAQQPQDQPLQGQSAQQTVVPQLMAETKQAGAGGSLVLAFEVVVGFLLTGLVVFFLLYRRTHRATRGAGDEVESMTDAARAGEVAKGEKQVGAKENKFEKQAAKAEADGALVKRVGKPLAHAAASSSSAPTVLFGAFRVEQEVDKLVRGTAHAVEVLASRASDDRRAVEVSLLKALASPELSEAERNRARMALEEYGFVARQSASLLLAPDAYERSSAARTLGRIKSAASLSFLLEALYDADPIVRAEAVASLGTLGLPRAIGALLDTARRHPEIPASLVARALDACSVEAVEFDSLVEDFAPGGFSGDITRLEPIAAVDQLPEWLEDEALADSLERLSADDVEARVAAAQRLSQFQVKSAVDALASMAASDKDASVRAAAVTSLGTINHESVFAAVLIAMADESREVRAAAARALSRLCFDRADAYVRLLETADDETLRRTAEACVTAGLARQAMDRLASEDRRQAYEAFSLLSVVAHGGQSDVLVSVVRAHPDLSVRLASARLLALQGDEAVSTRLRQIAMEGTTPEKLREAILEFCDRRRQPRDGSAPFAAHESSQVASPSQVTPPSLQPGGEVESAEQFAETPSQEAS
ncbi:MAG: HEAT repeat domain-containing protein [Acidobacteria bacterium]|nr:HEAT repeat domain-containing protein [Acidobacteriota bacterium]